MQDTIEQQAAFIGNILTGLEQKVSSILSGLAALQGGLQRQLVAWILQLARRPAALKVRRAATAWKAFIARHPDCTADREPHD
jgi:hypothetical protein